MSDGHDAPSGLEMARAMLAAGGRAPIGKTLGFTLVEVDDGRAVFTGDPGEETYNPMGTVHGGYAATLLDSACGFATLSKLAPGQSFTTLELKVAYHRAMSAKTGPVRAEAVITAFGRRIAYAEGKLTDAAGKLLASATSTLLVLDP